MQDISGDSMTLEELKAFVRKYMVEDIVQDFDDFLATATAEELKVLYKQLVQVNEKARAESAQLIANLKEKRNTTKVQSSTIEKTDTKGAVRWD